MLEDHLYKYNESNLSNQTNNVNLFVYDSSHSYSCAPPYSKSSAIKQNKKLKDLNSNLQEMNQSRSFLELINVDITENFKQNESKNNSNFDMDFAVQMRNLLIKIT